MESQEIIQVICKPKDNKTHPDRARIYLAASASHRSNYVGRCSHPQFIVLCAIEIFVVFVDGVKPLFRCAPAIFHCTQCFLQHRSIAAVGIINQKLTRRLKHRQLSCSSSNEIKYAIVIRYEVVISQARTVWNRSASVPSSGRRELVLAHSSKSSAACSGCHPALPHRHCRRSLGSYFNTITA